MAKEISPKNPKAEVAADQTSDKEADRKSMRKTSMRKTSMRKTACS